MQKYDPFLKEVAEKISNESNVTIDPALVNQWLDTNGFVLDNLHDAEIYETAKAEILQGLVTNQESTNGSSDALARMEQSFQKAFNEYDSYLEDYENHWASRFAKREKAVRTNVHKRIQEQLGGSDVEENFLSELKSTLRSKFPVS